MSIRPVKHESTATPTMEGAGVKLHRVFGFGDPSMTDPFLMMDDFRNDNPAEYIRGFPWHPHRGIETITYVLAGTVEHGDSLGNSGLLGAGDIQWMTAGSGIMHQEMPKGDFAGRMHGFQLWANLPSSLKMTAPRYQDVKSTDIPVVVDDDGTAVRVICGNFWGKAGPVDGVAAEPIYLDVSVPPGQEEAPAGRYLPQCLRLYLRRLRHLPRRIETLRRARREGSRRRRAEHPRHVRQPHAGRLRQRRRSDGSGGRRGHPFPARLWQTDRGAGCLARPDRDEFARGNHAGDARTAERHLHQGCDIERISSCICENFGLPFEPSTTERKEGDPMSNEISDLVTGMEVVKKARQPSL